MTPPLRDLKQTISRLPTPGLPRLPAPAYTPPAEVGSRVALAVASMQAHTSNEGWEVMQALEHAGYKLVGRGLPRDETNVVKVLTHLRPGVVVVMDKREWDLSPRDFRDPAAAFQHVEALRDTPDVFTLTILKDSHQRPEYHRDSADEIGCHAWLIYYHPDIVCHLAPYVRPEHLVRTYHSVDRNLVPPYTAEGRAGCLLSGAVSGVYPLRTRLFWEAGSLPEVTVLKHPGYHRQGSATPAFLQTLSRHKVAICTSSIYGYALRKLAEASACGCVVVTDLPTDEVMPEIDENCYRVSPDMTTQQMGALLRELYAAYDPEKQRHFAVRALNFYDFRAVGLRLADDIETLRKGYVCR